jgi:hypothetical protein
MSQNAQASVDAAQTKASGMRDEIAQKWPKFTTEEISALKSTEDLVSGVQSKYSLGKDQAQRDVDAFAQGRQL